MLCVRRKDVPKCSVKHATTPTEQVVPSFLQRYGLCKTGLRGVWRVGAAGRPYAAMDNRGASGTCGDCCYNDGPFVYNVYTQGTYA